MILLYSSIQKSKNLEELKLFFIRSATIPSSLTSLNKFIFFTSILAYLNFPTSRASAFTISWSFLTINAINCGLQDDVLNFWRMWEILPLSFVLFIIQSNLVKGKS